MLDNKTAQECWAGPVVIDDGMAELKQAQDESNKATDRMAALIRERYTTYPGGKKQYSDKEIDAAIQSETAPAEAAWARKTAAEVRVEYLKQHPDEQKVHVRGLPYCSELK